MKFGKLEKLDLRSIWAKEATKFTPWLAENISELGETLGMDLELEQREAAVGKFSLDLLARNLGTDEFVIIENQLTQTDHDHLGKLLTYAAGYDASTIIWLAETIRDEHRQALEWLNQRTDSKTQFFAVIVEVFKIDKSAPAYRFRPIVFPNEWQKNKRQRSQGTTSERGMKYQSFFQALMDELREKHKFTGAKTAPPKNWVAFSAGISSFYFSASFAQGKRVRAEVYIGGGSQDQNNHLFDELIKSKTKIEAKYGEELSWEKLDDKKACRVAIYRSGSIDDNADTQDSIHQWIIEHLLRLKKVFVPIIKKIGS